MPFPAVRILLKHSLICPCMRSVLQARLLLVPCYVGGPRALGCLPSPEETVTIIFCLVRKFGFRRHKTHAKILILVRTTPLDQVSKPSHGLSLSDTDLDSSVVEIREIPKMGRASVDTNSLFFDNWHVPATDLVGQENKVFKMILHGMNAQRILITAEAPGLGYAAVQRAATYAGERRVFGQAIGQNQAIQHPLADS